MNPTGPPLFLFHDHSICDRCGGDMDVRFDGLDLTAATDGLEAIAWERDGTDLAVVCGNVYADQPCRGVVHFNLTTENAWEAAS